MAKGGNFEREICKKLSRWWADREDIFWRTSNSGGRATVRGKVQKRTAGQYGDITATDPIGMPLTDVLCFEVKRGYPRANIHDILDISPAGAKPLFLKFIDQAVTAQHKAGAFSWALIHRRDRREPWIFFPDYFFGQLQRVGAFATYPSGMVSFSFIHPEAETLIAVGGCHLDGFLEAVTPEQIKRISKEN